ncbi:hypothetical protein RJ639_017818 [Escallonia herrerae]|uniref:Uncharacterized protein n=1 Tax=Escallonia herrerae TaxID=1293975 RepID=A0AA89ANC7_9ASTE|nr:hypothetical protein RJ639_017818 [Escallonia herrerae]
MFLLFFFFSSISVTTIWSTVSKSFSEQGNDSGFPASNSSSYFSSNSLMRSDEKNSTGTLYLLPSSPTYTGTTPATGSRPILKPLAFGLSPTIPGETSKTQRLTLGLLVEQFKMAVLSRGLTKMLGSKGCKGGYSKLGKTDTQKPVPGVVPVYVGEEGNRYCVPVEFFSSFRIKDLLGKYEDELEDGRPLSLPCSEQQLEAVLKLVKTDMREEKKRKKKQLHR